MMLTMCTGSSSMDTRRSCWLVNTGMSSLMVLNMASGFAEAGRVWQKPAAAVEGLDENMRQCR